MLSFYFPSKSTERFTRLNNEYDNDANEMNGISCFFLFSLLPFFCYVYTVFAWISSNFGLCEWEQCNFYRCNKYTQKTKKIECKKSYQVFEADFQWKRNIFRANEWDFHNFSSNNFCLHIKTKAKASGQLESLKSIRQRCKFFLIRIINFLFCRTITNSLSVKS